MIEVIYKDEGQEMPEAADGFSIPRNIRQIGFTDGNYKIYIEDYVYTFLGRTVVNTNAGKGSLAVLTGETRWYQGDVYLFIKGAVLMEPADISEEYMDFSDELWQNMQEEQKRFFADQEIVGWFWAKDQIPMKATDDLTRLHMRYFGADKVLFLMEPTEHEEAFFCYENNFLVKQRGYYIFYEKNTTMRDYMMEKQKEMPGEQEEPVKDEAVKNFRTIIRNKKEPQEKDPEKRTEVHASVFSYAATVCLALAVLATGTGLYRNYRSYRMIREEANPVSAVIRPEETKPTAVPRPTPGPKAAEKQRRQKKDAKNLTEEAAQISETDVWEENSQSTSDSLEPDLNDPAVATFAGSENNGEDIMRYQQESDDRKIGRNHGHQEEKDSREASSQTVHPTYVIRPGDTIYEISIQKYGSLDMVEEICSLNGLEENETIYPGQVLVLP